MTSNIKNIWPIQIGEVGVNPNYFKIECTDSLGTITTAGYMPPVFQGYSFGPQTVFFFLFGSATTPSFGIFVPTFSKTVIGASTMTLNAWVNQGVVTAPVTSGDLPKFSGTTGLMVDSNLVASKIPQTSGSLINNDLAAWSGTSGTIIDSGLSIANTPQFSGSVVSGNVVEGGVTSGTVSDAGIAANKVLTASFVTPDVNANFVPQTFANMANANIVAGTTLFTPSGSATYFCFGAVLEITQSFAGGSNNSALSFAAGSTTFITATNTTIKASANAYALGTAGFTFAATAGTSPNITSANPLKIVANASSDYTGGIANGYFLLLRTS